MSLKLFEKFVAAEDLLGYMDELYKCLYACAVEDFDREVRANVFFVAFGNEYSVSVEEFYRFDREYAVDTWLLFVGNWIDVFILEEVYKSECAEITVEKIDTLINRFIEWLRTLDHDEIDAELATKLLTGEVTERDVALRGLAAYLHSYTHCAWYYPTN